MSPTLTSLEDFANFPLIWILPLSATSFATDRLLMIRDIFKICLIAYLIPHFLIFV